MTRVNFRAILRRMLQLSDRRFITSDDAANLVNVGVSTIRGWANGGRIAFEEVDGAKMIDLAAFRGTKLLRDKQFLSLPALMKLGVDQGDLARAVADGAVSPSKGPGRCFSLDDADALVAFKGGTWTPPSAESPPETQADDGAGEDDAGPLDPRTDASADTSRTTADVADDDAIPMPEGAAEFLVRSGRWPALRAYIIEHKDPFKLPPTFWDTRTCPEFIPPAGVFLFVYSTIYEDEEGNPCTGIKRSEGWVWDPATRTLQFVAEDGCHDCVETLIWPPGTEPPAYRLHNLRWKAAKRDWEEAWHIRRRQLHDEGVDLSGLPDLGATNRRGRLKILETYRHEHWSPSDLPDWFWDVPQCPPFEPPAGVARFEHGAQDEDPNGSGLLGTWIRRSGMWQHPMFEQPFFEPADECVEWVPGSSKRARCRRSMSRRATTTISRSWSGRRSTGFGGASDGVRADAATNRCGNAGRSERRTSGAGAVPAQCWRHFVLIQWPFRFRSVAVLEQFRRRSGANVLALAQVRASSGGRSVSLLRRD